MRGNFVPNMNQGSFAPPAGRYVVKGTQPSFQGSQGFVPRNAQPAMPLPNGGMPMPVGGPMNQMPIVNNNPMGGAPNMAPMQMPQNNMPIPQQAAQFMMSQSPANVFN
jgi:hypothetical protein